MAPEEAKYIPPLIDLHQDISLYLRSHEFGYDFKVADLRLDLEKRHADVPKYWKANTSLVFSSISPVSPTSSKAKTELLSQGYGIQMPGLRIRDAKSIAWKHMHTYAELLKKDEVYFMSILDKEDFVSLGAFPIIGLLISLEGSEALEDVEDLDSFYNYGLRSLQLTWNFDTRYAAACMSKKDYGLTGDGEELVNACNNLGVILDLAHASKNTLIETANLSKLPVIVSHANVKGVKDSPRNLDDEELEVIKKNHGVVGISFIGPMVSDKPTLESLTDHIMYVYDRFGGDMISIGSDYLGILLPGRPPEGLEDISKIGNLWKALEQRGLRADEIKNISHDNAARVIIANAEKMRKHE